MLKIASFGFLAVVALATPPAHAAPSHHVSARLVTEQAGIPIGASTRAGLAFKIEPGWHIYWKNPGDTGLPTRIQWLETAGLKPGDLLWPTPRRFVIGNLVNFGYENEILLPFELKAPADLTPGERVIRATAKLLVCRDSCVPENLPLEMPISVANRAFPLTADAPRFRRANAEEPSMAPLGSAIAAISRGHLIVDLNPSGPTLSASAAVFPEDRGIYKLLTAKTAVHEGMLRYDVELTNPLLPPQLARLAFVVRENSRSVRFELPTPSPAVATDNYGILEMILFAFLGGMILNLMPCVFPVLSIKVLDLVGDAASSSSAKIKAKGLFYTAGVVLSFWVLTVALLILQHLGRNVGWGFQLQSPGFIASLIFLFMLIGLNLLGTFEVATRLMGIGHGGPASHRTGYGAAFFTGILSVIVASPCTAPFMGVALGFALSQPTWVALAVFTSLGLGLAAPFVALLSSPSLIQRLPKPGSWMLTMKKLLAFPIFATVAWLVWVFSLQVGGQGPGLIRILLALVMIAMAAWFYGDWVQLGRTSRVKRIGAGLALILAIGAGVATVNAIHGETNEKQWEPFSQARLDELRKNGTPVFVDYTAAWCLTCHVNESIAFTDKVLAALREKGFVLLRADWTSEDARITESLRSYGRSGVPLYVVFGKGSATPPKILPQVITPPILLNAIAD